MRFCLSLRTRKKRPESAFFNIIISWIDQGLGFTNSSSTRILPQFSQTSTFLR